jgi:glycosyltransferase involved in cell wall biosynthesis
MIAFVSTMEDVAWGGSEELWAQTALELVRRGHEVRASVKGWEQLHPRVQQVAAAGVTVVPRRQSPPIWTKVWRRYVSHRHADRYWAPEIEAFLAGAARPDLIVISEGANFPHPDVLAVVAAAAPYVVVSHCNSTGWWPDDETAARLRPLVSGARQWFTVSQGNLRLAEAQLGAPIGNSAIVRNPYGVSYDVDLAWPDDSGPLRMACVGRLDPRSKGQDLLLDALSRAPWRDRDWRLTFYGAGPMAANIQRLIDMHGLADRAVIGGHVDGVDDIWRSHHLLVQPSRFEGLPLTIVEAMMCARPVVATDVAGHAEVVDDGVTGFLAAAATADAIAAALDAAWSKRQELQQMGKAGAERIRQLMPRDAAAVFADELIALAGATPAREARWGSP